jgi:zinc protease
VIVARDATNPIVAVRAAWLGGLRAEGDSTSGYTHLMTSMATRGTSRKSAADIAELVDGMAGSVDGFAGRNSFGLRGTFLKAASDRGLDLLFECLRDAAFHDDELGRQQAQVLEDLRARSDNPAGLVFELFNKALWKTHPYRRDILGTATSMRAVTSTSLRSFWHDSIVQPAVLAFVGDVDADEIVELCARQLPLPSTSSLPRITVAEEPVNTDTRIVRLVRNKAQAHLVLGHRGIALNDDDRFALEALSTVLSGQGGRLFLELRDKQSLCYSVSAFNVEGVEPGSFSVYMGTSPDKVDRALAGIEGLLQRVLDDGITAAELDRAQRYLLGAHDIGLQRLGARASSMSLNELYGLGHLEHTRYAGQLMAVTLEDVRRVARRVLDPVGRVLSIVGPEGTGGPAANLEIPLELT